MTNRDGVHAVNMARVTAKLTAIADGAATERGTAVRKLILEACIGVCLPLPKRTPCCCATDCCNMATELSLTAVACGKDGIFALHSEGWSP